MQCKFIWFLSVVTQATGFAARFETPFTVPLEKQSVPVIHNGNVVALKSAYYGTIYVGAPVPQKFTVIFDTGSGHLFLPSVTCEDLPCLLHRRYNKTASTTAAEPPDDENLVNVAYGTGEIAGEIVQETVCLGDDVAPRDTLDEGGQIVKNCVNMHIISAEEMTDSPFSEFKFDGVLGLGLTSLALTPEFHLVNQMLRTRNLAPVFSVFLSEQEDMPSEITFGGYDERRMFSDLSWTPVVSPNEGYWRVKVHSVRIGSEQLSMCDGNEGCAAILDTGTSMIGVPSKWVSKFLVKTSRELLDEPSELDCRGVEGPTVTFDLGGGVSVELAPKDYSRPTPSRVLSLETNTTHTICRPSLLPVNLPKVGENVFLWGEPILRKYYTSYDTYKMRVGFSLAVQPSLAFSARPAEPTLNSPSQANQPLTVVI